METITAKKVGDLIPGAVKASQGKDEIAIIKSSKLTRKQSSEEFIKVFKTKDPAGKFEMVSRQVKGIAKTHETTILPGRVPARNEPEVVYIMVLELFSFAGMNDKNLIRTVVDILIDSYGWMSLQDFALFFKKIKSGTYGEVYGKMNGMWITGKIVNFEKSVQYNVIRDSEAEHFKRKEEDGDRDMDNYYSDIMPEIIE